LAASGFFTEESADDRPVFYVGFRIRRCCVERPKAIGTWQFAGKLNFAFKAHQPIAQIESFSREERVALPVSKNFPIKNDLGDSFGSNWPQQFVVPGSQYKRVITAVVERWAGELGKRGIEIFDIQKFMAAFDEVTDLPAR
jgi:hypothetical protein